MTEEVKTEAISKQPRVLRLTAVLPAAASIAAFILVLILVISGTKPGTFPEYDLVSLNTSKLGQNIIEFTPTSTSTSSTPAKRADPLDPLGLLPTPSSISSSDPLGAIGSFFSGLIQNATAGIDGGLNDAEAQLVGAVLSELGIKEYYSLHLLQICSGDLTTSNPKNVKIDKCSSYTDRGSGISNFFSSIPSSITVLTTNISVPLLSELSSAGSYISTTISDFNKTIFAFLIITLASSFLTATLSALSILYSSSRILISLLLGFSTLGLIFVLAASVAATIMIELLSDLVNQFGDSVGLRARAGKGYLILTWVSSGLLQLGNAYWVAVWFVEFRRWAFKKRLRTEDEVGNWSGVVREVRRDFKID